MKSGQAETSKMPEPELELLSSRGYDEYEHHMVEGQVKNISGKRIDGVFVIVTWLTDSGAFVKTSEALIDFNPILPYQTSPFKTITTSNPEMKKYTVNFRRGFSGTIPTRDVRDQSRLNSAQDIAAMEALPPGLFKTKLAELVRAAGFRCETASKTFRKGVAPDDAIWWSVSCDSGDYSLQFANGGKGRSAVQACAGLKTVANIDCWTAFSQ